MKLIEREIRDGKPYGGTWIGKVSRIYRLKPNEVDEAYEILKFGFPFGTELRQEVKIVREPLDPFGIYGTVALKAILWGRAFVIQRLFQGHRKRRKKVWINGQRKKV